MYEEVARYLSSSHEGQNGRAAVIAIAFIMVGSGKQPWNQGVFQKGSVAFDPTYPPVSADYLSKLRP